MLYQNHVPRPMEKFAQSRSLQFLFVSCYTVATNWTLRQGGGWIWDLSVTGRLPTSVLGNHSVHRVEREVGHFTLMVDESVGTLWRVLQRHCHSNGVYAVDLSFKPGWASV
jgi:hypothetical protein